MKIPENIEIENKELCKACGGWCCKHCGCVYSPDNFESLSFSYLKSKLEEGHISIISQFLISPKNVSYYLYLRARNLDREIVDLFSLKNTCASLQEDGCFFSKEERPQGGILYIPKENRQCQMLYTSDIGGKEWQHYQKVLERLVRHFSNKSSLEKLKEDIIEVAYQLSSKIEQDHILLENLSEEEKEIQETLRLIFPSFQEEVVKGYLLTKIKKKQ